MKKALFPFLVLPLTIASCSAPETVDVPTLDTTSSPTVDTLAAAVEENDVPVVEVDTVATAFMISPASVGPVSVGATYDMLVNAFGADNVLSETRMVEGEEYEIWAIRSADGDLLFEMDLITGEGGGGEGGETEVNRITVYDASYKTAQGIGVGNTFAEINAAHGEIEVISGEPGVMIYAADNENVAYILDAVDHDYTEPEITADEVPADSKVVAVYTFGND